MSEQQQQQQQQYQQQQQQQYQQQQQTDWRESLPESIRNWDEVKNAEQPEQFWQQVENMRSRLGRSITIPGPDAGEEQRKEFLEKLRNHVPELMPTPKEPEDFESVLRMMGYPESPDKYQFPELQPPEGIQLNEEKLNSFRQLAYEAGLTQRQFEKLVQLYLDQEFQTLEQHLQQHQTQLANLKNKWGAAFDQRVQQAMAIKEQYFSHLPNELDAATIESFYNLAEALGQEGALQAPPDKQTLTPEEAALQLSEIYNNPQHPYWNPQDPGHEAAKSRVKKLIAMKLGSTPT